MSFYKFIEGFKNFDFENYFSGVKDSFVEKSLSKEKIDYFDFLNLLSDKAEKYLEQTVLKSHKITNQYFGKTIQLYAPIYVSNYCTNGCVYCGFNKNNQIERRKLNPEEIEKEAIEIAKSGIKHILFLTGESKEKSDFTYIKETLIILKKYFHSVSIEVYPLEEKEYFELREAGLDGVTIYQETYDEEIYQKVHLYGKKREYRYRLDTPERAACAGVRQVGIGSLFGLADLEKEAFFCGLHAKYLTEKYIDTDIGISLPRIKNACGGFKPKKELSDKKFVQFLAALRLFLPKAAINLSTREDEKFRDNLIGLGVTKMSAGSKTEVGGYSNRENKNAQFEISDKRSAKEIDDTIRRKGFLPIYKDWESIR
ncbi:MAG TPA: 2-iminoacetate synthase ThiH [Spirochaetota bacterium]|nr:2-iminoacetate synthase ThiH [Spirochaetota bacterium]